MNVLGTFALATAVLLYLFGSSYNPDSLYAFFTMFGILLAGVVLSFIFVGWKVSPLNFKNLSIEIISTIIAFLSLYFVNKYVPVTLGVSPLSDTMFAVLSGVAEEWLFRLWLCAWVDKITGLWWFAVLSSSGVWAWFHLARASAFGVGPVNWGYLTLVFACGLPLGFLTLYFRNADGPAFAHMIVNGLSGSG